MIFSYYMYKLYTVCDIYIYDILSIFVGLFRQKFVLTGVACSTEGGNQTLMNIRGSGSASQFQCVCTGAVSPVGHRHCCIHYWMCPLIS